MKHNIYKIAFAGLLGGLLLSSCNDFLDVRPKSEKVQNDLFSSSKGFEDAINGVYGSLQMSTLYGRDLLWGVNEVLAQNLQCTSTTMTAMSIYDYTNDYVKQELSSIWTSAYQTIGYANNVLEQLGDKSNGMTYYNLYKGEMLGVRAMLHFDMLRLFAPTDTTKTGIPYSTSYSKTVNPFLTVGEDYRRIIADLKEAESLLSEDTELMAYPRNNSHYDKFANYRETHCNLYAVQALLARVYWMKGDMAQAGEYAEKVISSGKFPLAEPTEVQDYLAGRLSPKETVFGVYSSTYLETCKNYLYTYQSYVSYNPYYDGSGSKHLLPYDALYNLDVEGTAQDYRRNHFVASGAYATFLKLVDYYLLEENGSEPDTRVNDITGVTLIHSSELYLIAAEAFLQTDYAKAVSYFDAERTSRGLPKLTAEQKLTQDMIYNEYHKELYGEGQFWYNMKRLNKPIVSNAQSKTIPASDNIYVLPIPDEEYQYR